MASVGRKEVTRGATGIRLGFVLKGGGISGAVGHCALRIGSEISHMKPRGLCKWHLWLSSTDPAKPYAPQHFSECPPDLPFQIQGLP